MKKFLLLSVFLLLGCASKREMNKSKISKETVKTVYVRDTIWKEKIIENKIVIRDTVERKNFDFNVKGKPTWDSINKVWKPFTFDYWIYQGTDSTRYKGSFTGEGEAGSVINWEKMYKTLLAQKNEKSTEASGSKTDIVNTEKFQEAKKNVSSEGYSLEIAIYVILGTAIIFYFLGLFTPKIKNILFSWLRIYIPFLFKNKE